MGYSATIKAYNVKEEIEKTRFFDTEKGCFFIEIGRENVDGAITGSVYENIRSTVLSECGKIVGCRRVGGFRIDKNGKIIRLAGLPKKKWRETEVRGIALFYTEFQQEA